MSSTSMHLNRELIYSCLEVSTWTNDNDSPECDAMMVLKSNELRVTHGAAFGI